MARTVLLADDSVTAQNMGRRILTDAGYEVITVNNGSAALKKIHETRPDLIVLDVYMPGYGGLEVCQRLKESGDTMRIPVLLTVGKMEPFKAEEAKRVRADGHIVKPFEASELLAALTKLEDRIVPNDSTRGKKREKKPSFWHGTDETQPPDWTDNVAYLSQAKQRKPETPEPEAPEAFEEVAPRKRTSDAPVPASGELPVVADSIAEVPPANVTAAAEVAEAGVADTAQPDVQKDADEQSAHVTDAAMERPAAPVVAAPRWVAQNVALTAEEAALELDREMQASEAAQATTPTESSEPESSWEVVEDSGTTFAAAAAAGASSASTVVANPANENEVEPQPGSEAVVAWENWQHIRDAVMNSQATDGVVEKAAQIAQAVSPSADATGSEGAEAAPSQPAAADEAPGTTDAVAEGENAALANIVDSVLAELKPKLMQEIAKKLKK